LIACSFSVLPEKDAQRVSERESATDKEIAMSRRTSSTIAATTSPATTSPATTSTTTHSIYTDFDDNEDETIGSHDNIDRSDVYISDRIQRLIQTLSPLDIDDDMDEDDEIHITSTGQTIRLQDLFSKNHQQHHHITNQKNNIRLQPSQPQRHVDSVAKSSYIARRYKDFITWTKSYRYCGGSIDQIWLFCGIATFTITISSLISLWYYRYYYSNRHRFTKNCTTSKHDSSTTSAMNTNTDGTIPLSKTVLVSPTQNETPIEVVDNKIVNDIATKTSNDTVPHLVQELLADNNINLNDAPTEPVLPEDISSTPCDKLHKQDHTIPTLPTSLISTITTAITPDDHADHVVSLISALQEKCQLNNIEYDNQILWQWAIQQQTTQQQIKTQEMMQILHCRYDHTQQTLNRYQQQQHHEATVTLLREDPEWFTKLTTVRNRCHDTILRTIYQSCMGLCAVVLVRPIVSIICVFDSNTSLMDVFCYNTGTRFDPHIHFQIPSSNHNEYISSTSTYYNYYTSWYDRYISTFTYIDTYTIWAMGDVVTCATLTLGRIVVVIASILAWHTTSWLLRQLTGGIPRLQLLINQWIPTLYLYRIMIALGMIFSICYGTITYRYCTLRNKFLNMKNTLPQISVVNQAISWFDDMVHHVQLLPIAVVSGLVLMLVTESK
jgi:hypothetical protein